MWLIKRKRKILIIDDDDALRALTKACLVATKQFQISEACNVAEALKQITRNRFDVLLLDLRMPGRNGLEILKMMVQKNLKSIPTIVMTNDKKFASLETAFDLGAKEYITKPFITETLLAKLSLV